MSPTAAKEIPQTGQRKKGLTMSGRWIMYGLSLLLLFTAGCGTTGIGMGVQTAGETPTLRWRAMDLRNYTVALEEREVYQYTLVLEETQGTAITFTHLKARFWNSSQSWPTDWEKTGQWTLPAGGTLDLPLGSYRYCIFSNCWDWGPLSPVWHLTLTGTTAQGQPVRERIELRLPYVQEFVESS